MDSLMGYLKDEDVQEVMLNPNKALWVDTVSKGMLPIGSMEGHVAQSIIFGIAGIIGKVVSSSYPILEAELPKVCGLNGERFTAQLPPIVRLPSFTIRKRSKHHFLLADYVATNRLSAQDAQIIKNWIRQRKNILVAGSPGSGKTTFTNALIQEAVLLNAKERFILLEDVAELVCLGENKLSLLTSCSISMRDLLKIAVRSRPDRIIVGEVRGQEAYDMLKAWNIGCSGGMGTLHASGAQEATQRLIDLSIESGLTMPPISLMCQTLGAIIFVDRSKEQSGFIKELALVEGYENGRFQLKHFGRSAMT